MRETPTTEDDDAVPQARQDRPQGVGCRDRDLAAQRRRGQTFTQQEVDRLLGRAGDLGVNLVDTAECYGDHLAEELIGAAIHQRRDEWMIATKFGHQFHPEAMGQDRWSPASVRRDHWTPQEVIAQLEGALRALGTDHVDLYQAHSAPDEVIDHDGLWEVLHQQVTKGTVRHLGLSLSGGDLHRARRTGQLGAGVIQVGYTAWTGPQKRGSSRSVWTRTWA